MTYEKTTKSLPTKAGKDSTSLTLGRSTGLESMFDRFFEPFDEFFKPIFPRAMRSPLWGREAFRQPILDIQDRGDHFSLTAELPGFTKDEVEVKVDSNGIELRAEKSEKESRGEGGSYQSRRSHYQYLRLPDQILTEKIDGTMKNGILELKLPKGAANVKDDARRVDLK